MPSFGLISIDGATIGLERTIEGKAFQQLLLWKPRLAEAVTVVNSDGRLFRARVTALGKVSAELFVYEESGLKPFEPEVVLLQALPEKERMELIIQKTTELGVEAVIPFKSERSITLAEFDEKQKKSHKWQDVALKAARQSRRATIPEVGVFRTFEEGLKYVKDSELKLMLYETQGIAGIKDALKGKKIKTVALLSGPEGGFTEREAEEAQRSGFVPVSLGSRILRTETAAITGVGIVMYELGE